MKKTIFAGLVLCAAYAGAVDWPSDVWENVQAREAAWPTAVTSSQYVLTTAVAATTSSALANFSYACDTFTAWVMYSSGISLDSDATAGICILVR
ncbi:MAG: hypothetical protein IJG13_12820 [Kiritimatiellae bacterium]|nr:hypothetical protein [Kiritimatiellia bacterium]MBQ3343144.1 hypothetical protein [Kiritimatiellia bacterium]MBQ6329796.1 hypothetical protein [Kiritimatiellia bacterium]